MQDTFRCVCGQTNNLPANWADAAAKTCPRCHRPLTHLFDPRENEARIKKEIGTAQAYRRTSPFLTMIGWSAIWGLIIFRRPTSTRVVGRGEDWWLGWLIIWGVSILFLAVLNISAANVFYKLRTGREYVQDRVAFAKAGCYEIAGWCPVVGFLCTYGGLWWSFENLSPDPVVFLRSPTAFVFVYWAASILLTFFASLVALRRRSMNT